MIESSLVSVIIPTYNREEYLLECVQSILNQTYRNIEIIIVSDGGTDDSELKINALGDNRIKWYNLNINYGRPAPARNYGLSVANGSYICFCDDDDLWVKDKLEKQFELLSDKYNICFSGFKILEQKLTRNMRLKSILICTLLKLSDGKGFFLLSVINPVCNSSILIKAKILENFQFNEKIELRAVEDYVGWITLFSKHSVAYSMDPLVVYRIHESNISSNRQSSLEALISFIRNSRSDFPLIWRYMFLFTNRLRLLFSG